MNRYPTHNDFIQDSLIDFICAGCSALIIALCFAFSGSWIFYLSALLPLLYRISNTDLMGSVLSGVFFVLSLAFVIYPAGFLNNSLLMAANILLLCATVVFLSIIVKKLKRYFLLSLILFAGLCFPLEYLLKTVIEYRLVLSIDTVNAGFIYRAVALLSFLFISFLIIAVNSILLRLLDVLIKLVFAGRLEGLPERRLPRAGIKIVILLKHWRCLPNLRAPPFCTQNQ